jgi:hypothetical protein
LPRLVRAVFAAGARSIALPDGRKELHGSIKIASIQPEAIRGVKLL